jgi:hypothetical protein
VSVSVLTAALWILLADIIRAVESEGLLDTFRNDVAELLNCFPQSARGIENAAGALPVVDAEQLAAAVWLMVNNRCADMRDAAVVLAVAAARLVERYPELCLLDAELAERATALKLKQAHDFPLARTLDDPKPTSPGGDA